MRYITFALAKGRLAGHDSIDIIEGPSESCLL